MRVLVLTESYPTPEHPGRGIFVREQVEALAGAHAVTVLFPRPMLPGIPSSMLEPHAKTLDQPNRPQTTMGTVRVERPGYLYVPRHRGIRAHQIATLLRRILREASHPFDLVHAHWLAPAGRAAVLGAADLGIPVVVTAHAGDVYRELRYPKHKLIAQQVIQRASRIIAVAEYFREPLKELAEKPEKIAVIPNGVDLSMFKVGDQVAARSNLNLPFGMPLYLYIGNLQQAKGVMDVVEAFFAGAPPDAVLVVAGTGPLWPYLARRAQASSGRLILRGWQDHGAVAQYLAAADCFVLASYAEGNPVTVLESLCCGTPVIATSIPAIVPLINEGRNGLLVPPGNITSLAHAMRILPAMTWNAGEIATHAAQRYGWEAVATRISDVYDAAVATSHRPLPMPMPVSSEL